MFAEVRVIQNFVEFLERFGPICDYYGVDQERRAECVQAAAYQPAVSDIDVRAVAGYEGENACKKLRRQSLDGRRCRDFSHRNEV